MKALALLPLVAIVGTGCFTVNAQLPGALRNDKAETEKIGTLNIEKDNYFFILGLIGAPGPDFFSAEIKKQVEAKGGDGVANLTYESSDGCLDLILSGCTAGCVTPRSYKVSGDIVRIKSGRLPGKAAKTASTGEPAAKVAQGY